MNIKKKRQTKMEVHSFYSQLIRTYFGFHFLKTKIRFELIRDSEGK